MKLPFFIILFPLLFHCTDIFCRNSFLSTSFNCKEEFRNKTETDSCRRISFFRETGDNLLIQSSYPLSINNKNLLPVLLGMGCTTGLILLDPNIDEKFRPIETKYKSVGTVSDQLTELGGIYGLGFSAAFAGYSYLFKNKKGIQTSRLLAESMISVTIWTWAGKLLTGRQRPLSSYTEDNDSKSKWSGPFQFLTSRGKKLPGSSFDAFPSGHTATAFALATVFSTQYPEHIAIPIISYSLASLVGITRMIEHEHWASDVFVGACIGYLCGKQVCKHALNPNRKNLQCNFYYHEKSLMTGCIYTF